MCCANVRGTEISSFGAFNTQTYQRIRSAPGYPLDP
jgi:hypothetical protein